MRKAVHLLVLALLALSTSTAAGPPPPGYSDIVRVRFAPGSDVSPPTDALPPGLAGSVSSMVKLFTLPAATLDALTAAGAGLPDLNLWFEITLNPGVDPGDFLASLQAAANVDAAEFAPLPSPLPATTPDFTANQGYLGPAPGGIDAQFAWTIPGGDGTGIRIYDVEYEWNQNHEDLSKAAGVTLLLDSGDVAVGPFNNNNHGTAVLGELIADNDTIGVTGISFGADIGLAPSNTQDLGLNVANAILLAVADSSPGDVILLEAQTAVCGAGPCDSTQVGCGPVEWNQATFDAIQTAVANRVTVVEAAGNGNVNLDQAGCNSLFDRTMRDSGAIIVGAGEPPGTDDRERRATSSFGSRVDVQGWGTGIMTTGYGTSYVDPDDPTNPNRFYRDSFGGTSGASPMVAGSVANLQGIALNQFGTPLLPFQLRALLRDTGSPQLGDTSQNIGPRPDLQAAIGEITAGAIDLFLVVDLSQSFEDDLPIFKAQAPDIIARIRTMNPNTRFGLASFRDYPIPPFGDPGDYAYQRHSDLTFEAQPILDAIAGLSTANGGDPPESQLAALYQAATGEGQDLGGEGFPDASIPSGQNANFRDGVTKLFLLWTDNSFHLADDPGDIAYPGPTFVEVVTAIENLDPPKVIGVSSGGGGLADLQAIASATDAFAPDGGVDCDDDGVVDIPAGDPLVCTIAASGEGIAEAITAVVEAIVDAARPVAVCTDVVTNTDPGVCTAAVSVDGGSQDPDGGPLVITQSPPGPYPVGTSAVTLKVTDDMGLSAYCVASVEVSDVEPPVPSCNAAPVTPPDRPIAFTASATDNCDVASVSISDASCFKTNQNGKTVDKSSSCKVSVAGDTLMIDHSGGVGTQITWSVSVTDVNGNDSSIGCAVTSGNPGSKP
jgi:hypothetical protein